MAYTKPLPIPGIESEPFWVNCSKHLFSLQRCSKCNRFWFPPAVLCPHCLSTEWKWEPVSGRGKVFSFVVYHRVYHPGFRNDIPYVVAVIELDEGPRFLSNLIECSSGSVYCGMPVQVVFEDVEDRVSLPKFRPIPGQVSS